MPRPRPYTRPWIDSGTREKLIRSAAKLLHYAFTEPDVDEVHRRHLLRDAFWSVTEMDGKYTTRYRSRGTLDLEADGPREHWQSQLRHDHVLTRKALSDRIRQGEDPAIVLREAIGCVVTKAEHDRLTPYDRTLSGWARYRAAQVEVVDMATGEPLVLDG